ncbi:hypothetical protein FHT00_001223 [Sphingomonas insulae]|uniref:WalW protein n=1 Tax=Sphingomonas insulae TaxID=424800 RepID=A0ABN1HR21_9SPHN|nr:polysaccharide deacetylase family protein [Sphingomonas insulae]NIJ29290.1 hypothetical protein [Sphingomonas insulae]
MADGVVSPYRPPRPAPGDVIAWPATFGDRFIVFVDVEEEFDWSAPRDRRHRAVTAMRAFPAAHRRFAERGIGLACMVDHPVASDAAAVDILNTVVADGRSSIGAQLHPWVNPPYAPLQPGDSYAGNLPIALEAAKLDTLTDLLHEAFGRRPLAYRAGRYGIGPATTALLAERGYRIDASVRARYDYRGDGGPDFSAIGSAAYRWDSLVEIPLTTVFTGRLRALGPALHPLLGRLPFGHGLGAGTGLLQRVALTPEDMPIDDALEAVRSALGEGQQRLLSFSFHSPSLASGHTPYVRDAADLARFWTWWDRMLDCLDRLNAMPTTLDELIAAAAHITDA